MSLQRVVLERGEALPPSDMHQALWVVSGALSCGARDVTAGDGCFSAPGRGERFSCATDAEVLVFQFGELGEGSLEKSSLLSEQFDLSAATVCLRLDQVTFPPGACAYRHTHPGPGIRYLTKGSLDIQADDHVSLKQPGDAWFEDAESPVKAVASPTEVSSFVRAMVLPMEYEGKPTILILDPADDAKPKLQNSRRFFDQRITL